MTQNEIIEIYNKYKGQKVSLNNAPNFYNKKGILAGYISGYLVGRDNEKGNPNWNDTIGTNAYREGHTSGDHYFTFNSLKGCIFEPIIPPTPELLAEEYINSHFKDLDENTRMKYIDVFIMGCNHKTE